MFSASLSVQAFFVFNGVYIAKWGSHIGYLGYRGGMDCQKWSGDFPFMDVSICT